MCDSCFQNLIYKFESAKEFEDFETVIQNKCIVGQIDIIDRHNENYLLAGLEPYNFYKCRSCNEIWILAIPDNAWRGFFLPQDKAIQYRKEIKRKERKAQIGCVVIVIVLTLIVIWKWFE